MLTAGAPDEHHAVIAGGGHALEELRLFGVYKFGGPQLFAGSRADRLQLVLEGDEIQPAVARGDVPVRAHAQSTDTSGKRAGFRGVRPLDLAARRVDSLDQVHGRSRIDRIADD